MYNLDISQLVAGRLARKSASMSLFDQGYIHTVILKRDQVSDFERYPYDLPFVSSLSNLHLHPKVTFFVGENGMGKSTLLEALAVAWGFNAEGGSKNFNFSTRASHSDLWENLTLVKSAVRPKDGYFLRAESFFTVATELDDLGPNILLSYGGTSLHEQSHGESFFSLFLKRFRGKGLYFLDEPEAALSPQRQMAFLRRLHDLVNRQSQFVIATHAPIILAYPDCLIYEFTENGLEVKRYDELAHVRLAKLFLDNPERMIKTLFES